MGEINTFLPLQLFNSGQLLRIPSNCSGGLILQLTHHAEFVGAGAAVGSSFDIKCVSVYTVGDVQLDVPATFAERKQAYHKRIGYMQRQQKITAMRAPLQRAYLIIRQLCLLLDVDQVRTIPDDLLAQLVGVFPKTIALAWLKYLQDHPELKATVKTRCDFDGATCQLSDRALVYSNSLHVL